MDLKSYGNKDINEFIDEAKKGKLSGDENQKIDYINKNYGNQLEDLINKFQNLDEMELVQEVLKIVNQKKAEGNFNPEEIVRIAQMIKPLLTPEQGKKLEFLISAII